MAVEKRNNYTDSTAILILKINQILLDYFGKPKRKLNSDPLDILIATILSQNTNDLNSHKAFLNLKNKFSDYEKIISTPLSKIEKEIKIAGLGKQKAKAIKSFLKNLKSEKGKLDLKFLERLGTIEALKYLSNFNGVGLKTAACVLLFGLKKNVCPVDTHVHRVLNRVGVVNTNSRDKTFYEIYKSLPDGIAHEFHTNLIKLGRTFCLSKNPRCFECPLKKMCKYEHKNLESTRAMKSKNNNNKDFLLLDVV